MICTKWILKTGYKRFPFNFVFNFNLLFFCSSILFSIIKISVDLLCTFFCVLFSYEHLTSRTFSVNIHANFKGWASMQLANREIIFFYEISLERVKIILRIIINNFICLKINKNSLDLCFCYTKFIQTNFIRNISFHKNCIVCRSLILGPENMVGPITISEERPFFLYRIM